MLLEFAIWCGLSALALWCLKGLARKGRKGNPKVHLLF